MSPETALTRFEPAMNTLFEEEHIGWLLDDGALEFRGEQPLEDVMQSANDDLEQSGFEVASQELREARADLSRRPEPDLSGAMQHATASLESVAREVSGDPNRTFGEIINKYPDLIPPPVDNAAAKMWGYASNQARHGSEGRQLHLAESLLVVGLSAVLCSYLNEKMGGL